jgi:hypothetical protein
MNWWDRFLLLETGAEDFGGGGEAEGGGSEEGGPDPVDFSSFTDDTMVRVAGQDDPVSWKDYNASKVDLSDYTKGREEFATERKQFDTERTRQEQFLREQWTQLQGLQQNMQAQPQQQQNAQPNRFEQVMGRLAQKGWADGKDLQEAFDAAHEGVNSMMDPMQQRIKENSDVMRLMWQHFQKMQQQVGTLGQTHTQNSMEDLFKPLLEENPWISESWLKDMYLSHEGNDLYEAFPGMARKRIAELSEGYQGHLKTKHAEAKNKGIPSQGGRTAPSLDIKKRSTPQDYARDVFKQLQAQDQST